MQAKNCVTGPGRFLYFHGTRDLTAAFQKGGHTILNGNDGGFNEDPRKQE